MKSEGVFIDEVTKGPILPFLNLAKTKEFHFGSLSDYFISALASTSFYIMRKIAFIFVSPFFTVKTRPFKTDEKESISRAWKGQARLIALSLQVLSCFRKKLVKTYVSTKNKN